MIANKIVKLAWVVGLAVGGTGGCKCQKDVQVEEEGGVIDQEPIARKEPEADRPRVYFPQTCQTDDITLNQFIDHTLDVCSLGDYDGFRQLFGTAFTPTGQKDFNRVWHGVQEVVVAEVKKHPSKDPPEYYVHAVVRLRKPDRKGRVQRDVVVAIFKEAGYWRLCPAPDEVGVSASSQPAGETEGGE